MAKSKGRMSSVFSFLPEGCISNVIALTTPKDATRALVISRDFKSASESDTVWRKFLPHDYREIISKSVGPPINYATKRDLYFSLCNFPIIIDDGKMSFWLSKSSGKKCYMLGAKELATSCKDTTQYWIWKSIPESRFAEVGMLNYVCLLEIKGKMNTQMLSLKTMYSAYLVFRITDNSYGFGFLVKASVRSAKDTADHDYSLVLLVPEPELLIDRLGQPHYICRPGMEPYNASRPQQRMDGWSEVLIGEFFNDDGNHGEIEMGLCEIDLLYGKRGLIVEGIEIRPKEEAV